MYLFFSVQNQLKKQLLNFRNVSVLRCFRNSLLTIIWTDLSLSNYKRMKRTLNLEKNTKKELFSPLFKRESSCSNAFVASVNHKGQKSSKIYKIQVQIYRM